MPSERAPIEDVLQQPRTTAMYVPDEYQWMQSKPVGLGGNKQRGMTIQGCFQLLS